MRRVMGTAAVVFAALSVLIAGVLLRRPWAETSGFDVTGILWLLSNVPLLVGWAAVAVFGGAAVYCLLNLDGPRAGGLGSRASEEQRLAEHLGVLTVPVAAIHPAAGAAARPATVPLAVAVADELVGHIFIERSRHFLVDEYLPRIRRCLDELSDDDVWWRPNAATNSVANLVLHLCGNARQWIVAGVGGERDDRRRQDEFDARGGPRREELRATLDRTMAEVVDILDHLDPARLPEDVHIQGRDVNVLGAIYHVVEHFGQHTGQIVLLTKARTARDLGFYRLENGIPRETF